MPQSISRLAFVLTLALLLPACSDTAERPRQEPGYDQGVTLSDIAYREGDSEAGRLLIGGDPYLVLTDDYQGSCLLLREHVMDEDRIYNRPGDSAAYYPGSDIDEYLSGSFIEGLPDDIRPMIEDTEIEVTAKDSLYVSGDETETVTRKVFLLSYREVGGWARRTVLDEGSDLSYFDSDERRQATKEDGSTHSWWLRSPSTTSGTVATGVSPTGGPGIGGIYDPNVEDGYKNGVRPAFCVDGRANVSKVEKGVFTIDE